MRRRDPPQYRTNAQRHRVRAQRGVMTLDVGSESIGQRMRFSQRADLRSAVSECQPVVVIELGERNSAMGGTPNG